MLPYQVCLSVGVFSKENEEKRVFCVALDLLENINLANIGTKDKGHGGRFNSRMKSIVVLGLHQTLR